MSESPVKQIQNNLRQSNCATFNSTGKFGASRATNFAGQALNNPQKVDARCTVNFDKQEGILTLQSPPKVFKAHYNDLGEQIMMEVEEIGIGLATPISQTSFSKIGCDAEVQCTYEHDNTLDQYLEDLREANKQADLNKM